MKIQDRIYGSFVITSPVIVEIIKSKPLQRLKQISQMGPPNEYYHLKGYSRFEHSIGVLLLLKYLGASESEQLAGLIHDVSHTAFSHVVDWVVGSGNTESYQDKQHTAVVKKSEIVSLLIQHGYNPKKILDYHRFPLLEREIPHLCADRIDYSLREFPNAIAKHCFQNLTVIKNNIVFKNKKVAQVFAYHFLLRQKTHWAGYEAVTRYKLFSYILRIALTDNLIKMDDFMHEESYIINKLLQSSNPSINKILTILQNKDLAFLPKSTTATKKKFRYVDPLFLDKKNVFLLSKKDPDFIKHLANVRKNNQNGIKTGIV